MAGRIGRRVITLENIQLAETEVSKFFTTCPVGATLSKIEVINNN